MNDIKKIGAVKDNALLNYFVNEELNNLVDDVFKEHNLIFTDIYYYADLPAYVAYNNDGKKNGVIIKFVLDGEQLSIVPRENGEEAKTYYDYFYEGFKGLGYKVLLITINLCTDNFVNKPNDNKNKRMFVNKDKDYWKVIDNKQNGERIYIFYPNLMLL